MENKQGYVKYTYKKYENLPIPCGSEGKVLLSVKHTVTHKLLVDFGKYGKAIVPISAVENLCHNS